MYLITDNHHITDIHHMHHTIHKNKTNNKQVNLDILRALCFVSLSEGDKTQRSFNLASKEI